mgnify:CR=1 FL=1
MSDRLCNFCMLNDMKVRAKERGVELIVVVHYEGEWKGWTTAQYSNQPKPSAYFMEVTTKCAC